MVVAVATGVSLLGAACEPTSSADVRRSASSSHTPDVSAARLRIEPADGTTDADPTGGISVTAARGTITSVTVQTQGGRVVGRLRAGGTRWHSAWALNTNARFTVRATAVDGTGRSVTARSTFRTLDPSRTFSTHIFEGYRKTYGVGASA